MRGRGGEDENQVKSVMTSNALFKCIGKHYAW